MQIDSQPQAATMGDQLINMENETNLGYQTSLGGAGNYEGTVADQQGEMVNSYQEPLQDVNTETWIPQQLVSIENPDAPQIADRGRSSLGISSEFKKTFLW
jgi:hypothetical protein